MTELLVAVTRCVNACAAFIVALAAPSLAYGQTDSKTFPGTFCRAEVSTGGDLRYETDGSLINNSLTETLDVICPVVRDNTQTKGGWEMRVIVVDESDASNVECTARSHRTFGPILPDGEDTGSSMGADMGIQEILLLPMEQEKVGYSTLSCSLPPRSGALAVPSRLVMYRTTELSLGEPKKDSKTYTGALAELGSFLGTGDPPFIDYNFLGWTTRTAEDGFMTWAIPVVRDTVAEPWKQVIVHVIDDDPFDTEEEVNDFICGMNAFDASGTLFGEASGIAESKATFGITTVKIKPNVKNVFTDGPYVISCLVPQGLSVVTMYDVQER